jgi:hypothetical protein
VVFMILLAVYRTYGYHEPGTASASLPLDKYHSGHVLFPVHNLVCLELDIIPV